jgi:hypothetical protein
MGGAKGCKGKGWKRKDMIPNVSGFTIGPTSDFIQAKSPMQVVVFAATNPKQGGHPYNAITFASCTFGHYQMKIIPTHLFEVVEALDSPHPTLKKLMEFIKNVCIFVCWIICIRCSIFWCLECLCV